MSNFEMMKMNKQFASTGCSFILLLSAIAWLCSPSFATTDVAYVKSTYFSNISDFSDDGSSETYARLWRKWLQQYRAIETMPSLKRQLRQRPAHYYTGRGRDLSWLYQRLPASRIRLQSAHIYVLQLGSYKNERGIERFMQRNWPRVSKKAIYAQTRKSFYIWANSEADTKRDPLFVMQAKVRGRSVFRLNYGLYASQQDAQRDAAQFKRYLGVSALVKRQALTGRLAHARHF